METKSKSKKNKTYLYFIKDNTDGSFWDGGYSFEISQRWSKDSKVKHLKSGFNIRPRYFKTPAAMLQSYTYSRIPASEWKTQYKIDNPPVYKYNEYYERDEFTSEYRRALRDAWAIHVKKNKINSLDILKLFAAEDGFTIYQLEDGKAVRSAKVI